MRLSRTSCRRQLLIFTIAIVSLLGCKKQSDPFLTYLNSQVSSDRMDSSMKAIASKPHRAGSAQNRIVGDYLLNALNQAGLKTSFAEYEVELPEPVDAQLAIVGENGEQKLDLHEKGFPEDAFTESAGQDLPFFAFSPDADLTAPVIYVNFGRQEDYDLLRKMNISAAGKIVLLRAQGICRGMKGKIAEKEGAAGLLLYPELKDQGFVKQAYPNGPMLNPWTIMRGSMIRYFEEPGAPADSEVLPRIPSLPISESMAQQIFQTMNGPAAPSDWTGLLPVHYSPGPGTVPLHLVYHGRSIRGKIRNILGEIKGTHPDEGTIVIGSHYDAWVFGAADPSSGTTTVLAAAQALAGMRANGWSPRRNILFAFWDGEEYGMFGSTKWVQENETNKIAAYINVDSAVRAHDFLGNVMPGLRHALDEVLAEVQDPLSGTALSEVRPQYDLPGFSSDTTPFLGLTGIPVAEIGFGRWYSVYHSMYDNLNWYTRFNDPGYRYTTTLVKVLALFARDLSSDESFPYSFTEVGEFVKQNLPGPCRSRELQDELERFLTAARDRENPQKQAHSTNTLEAIRCFSNQGAPFGSRNLLVGPSPKEGCSSAKVPCISSQQSARLLQALSCARRLMNHRDTGSQR